MSKYSRGEAVKSRIGMIPLFWERVVAMRLSCGTNGSERNRQLIALVARNLGTTVAFSDDPVSRAKANCGHHAAHVRLMATDWTLLRERMQVAHDMHFQCKALARRRGRSPLDFETDAAGVF